MNISQTNTALVFTLIFLLPMVPAAFFFSVLKSEAILTGPLKGFDAKFGGAFAAYFGTALLAVGTYPLWKLTPPPVIHEVWTVDGRVLDERGQPIQLFDEGDISIDPRNPYRGADGYFTVTATSTPTTGDYARIVIRHGGVPGPTIDLNPAAHDPNVLSRDASTTRIHLKAVQVSAPPPYAPTETAAPTSTGRATP